MRDTSVSLTQIALICGFTDQSHLSRWFRAVHGDAPSACRRRWRALERETLEQTTALPPTIEYRDRSGTPAPWHTSMAGLQRDAFSRPAVTDAPPQPGVVAGRPDG